jgi:hypothetical protein
MDQIQPLGKLVAEQMAWYGNAQGHKSRIYHFFDHEQGLYGVFSIPAPDHPYVKKMRFILFVRVEGDRVIIEEDITDRPFYEALLAQGLNREQLILTYAGEELPNLLEV